MESNNFSFDVNSMINSFGLSNITQIYEKDYEETSTIVKLIDDFKDSCKDLKPISIENIICNEKVFTK